MINIEFNIEKKVFDFFLPAGTSRGVLKHKSSWFVRLRYLSFEGIGECSIIEGLSPDFQNSEQYELSLRKTLLFVKKEANSLKNIEDLRLIIARFSPFYELTKFLPSIRFGIEMAILNLLNGKKNLFFINDFAKGNKKIAINGLVWMGDVSFMQKQINQKIKSGFTTIKLKIGALDFKEELFVLKEIRKKFSDNEITLRVDANGSFSIDEITSVLDELFKLKIHSIEQPIEVGQINEMASLCLKSPVPIVLDEELINYCNINDKKELLKKIQPQYIVLKPSLHGGVQGCDEWIEIAEELDVKWWITSALESNIGLTAICQYVAQYNNSLAQGLGTGSLYKNNLSSELEVKGGCIFQKSLI